MPKLPFGAEVTRAEHRFPLYEALKDWLIQYMTSNHGILPRGRGFIPKNGIFERFEPIGITWNDNYCRRITDAGPPGCFVERDLSASVNFDNQENNCTGKDPTNLLGSKGLLPASFPTILMRKF